MQEAIVTHASEAFRQDMLEDKHQEVGTGQGACFRNTRARFEIFESHPAVLIGEDVFLADDPAIEVGREILQGRLTTPNTFDVNDPVAWHGVGDVEAVVVERGEEARPEDFAERLFIEQIFTLDLEPLLPRVLYTAARHNDMQVGMEAKNTIFLHANRVM